MNLEIKPGLAQQPEVTTAASSTPLLNLRSTKVQSLTPHHLGNVHSPSLIALLKAVVRATFPSVHLYTRKTKQVQIHGARRAPLSKILRKKTNFSGEAKKHSHSRFPTFRRRLNPTHTRGHFSRTGRDRTTGCDGRGHTRRNGRRTYTHGGKESRLPFSSYTPLWTNK